MHTTKVFHWLLLGLTFTVILAGCSQISSANGVAPPESGPQAETEATEVIAVEEAVSPANNTPTTEQEASNVTEQKAPEDTPSTEPVLLAGTNVAIHSVPLDQVHFDTFNGSYIALSDADEGTILNLRDAIPPIATPKYENVDSANEWLRPNNIVIGYVDGDEALAYPTRIMNYHEIVNETVNGIPVLISYCPLCNSGIVYDRRLDDRVLEFGNTSALHNSDMVMYDKQTFSYWFQVGGNAIVGQLTGQRLAVLPTRFMRWEAWKTAFPDSRVLSQDTGFSRPYDRNPFTGLPQYLNQGRFPFPVGDDARNPALPAGARVLGLVVNNEAKAYPLEALSGEVVQDRVGDVPVAVAIDSAGNAVVCDRRLGDKILTLHRAEDALTDEETDSRWGLNGVATLGPQQGERLEIVPARFSFWFAFVAAFPEAEVYHP